ncbi:MAG: TatD family hydrolase [Chloroflexota bacterium]
MLSDTHAHLDDLRFHEDLDAVLYRAQEMGVDRVLAVGSDLESSRRAVAIAQEHEPVFAAVGMHPHGAHRFMKQAEELRRLLYEDKVVAIGEIGLDRVRENAPWATQVQAFKEQLRWAKSLDLPASVHNRGADDDVLSGVSEIGACAILHCFSGSIDFAARALSLGCYVSFAGNLTFPKARAVRDAACTIPDDRLLVETDSPVLAPQAWRGRRNEPAHVTAVVDALSLARETPRASLREHLSQNANRLFRWRNL